MCGRFGKDCGWPDSHSMTPRAVSNHSNGEGRDGGSTRAAFFLFVQLKQGNIKFSEWLCAVGGKFRADKVTKATDGKVHEAHAFPHVGSVMREFHYDAGKLEIIHPRCKRCGAPMWLTRLEPDEPDHDKRTFECKACGKTEVEIVKYR